MPAAWPRTARAALGPSILCGAAVRGQAAGIGALSMTIAIRSALCPRCVATSALEALGGAAVGDLHEPEPMRKIIIGLVANLMAIRHAPMLLCERHLGTGLQLAQRIRTAFTEIEGVRSREQAFPALMGWLVADSGISDAEWNELLTACLERGKNGRKRP
jgi:hypothetical protein